MADTKKLENRRRFLKIATLGMGGAVTALMSVPLLRFFLHPVGRRMVSTPEAPIDVAGVADIVAGAAPVRLPIIASGVRDAWNRLEDVAVGSCWLQKDEAGTVKAFSAVCPHLGCSVDFSQASNDFRCPCHNSAFAKDGTKKDDGPAKRGLDPLEVSIVDGRIRVRYQRFRNDIAEREPV